MGKSSNTRVAELLKTLNLSETEAANKINKQPATIYRIVKNEVSPTKTTLKMLADGLGANYEWLITGKGEMLAPKVMPISEGPWKDEALKDEVAFYRQLITAITGSKPNFHRGLKDAFSMIGIKVDQATLRPTG